MLVNVMVAAMANYPSLAFQPRCYPVSVRFKRPFGQRRDLQLMRQYLDIFSVGQSRAATFARRAPRAGDPRSYPRGLFGIERLSGTTHRAQAVIPPASRPCAVRRNKWLRTRQRPLAPPNIRVLRRYPRPCGEQCSSNVLGIPAGLRQGWQLTFESAYIAAGKL